MAKSPDTNSKKSIAEVAVGYLSTTPPLLMFIHLIWMMIASCFLSVSYIVAFHFTSVLTIYNSTYDETNKEYIVGLTAKQDAAINEVLYRLLDTTQSNRTYIFRYHNPLASVTGVPFFFQTNTHEAISPGTSRVMQFDKHVPTSMNIAINNQFIRNYCSIVAKTDADRDSQNYWFYQNRSAKSLIRCPMFSSNGDLIGFIGADFTNEIDYTDLANIQTPMKLAATAIANIIASTK